MTNNEFRGIVFTDINDKSLTKELLFNEISSARGSKFHTHMAQASKFLENLTLDI